MHSRQAKNVLGWSEATLINDVIEQYRKHMQFLHVAPKPTVAPATAKMYVSLELHDFLSILSTFVKKLDYIKKMIKFC